MNQGHFAGYVGRDAELRTTPGGTSVLNFSVAVSTGFGDNKQTLWVACALWGERAEKLEAYVAKGTPVAVSGDVDIRTWEHNGRHGAELRLNVQRLTFMGKAKDRDDRDEAPARQQERGMRRNGNSNGQAERGQTRDAWGGNAPARSAQAQQPAPAGDDDFDDDIPF
jgi:single-strand DNA-binding protein